MKAKLYLTLFYFLIVLSTKTYSQSAYQPLGGYAYDMLDRYEIKSGKFLKNIHTSNKPYLREDIITSLSQLDTMKHTWSSVDTSNFNWLKIDNSEWTKYKFSKSKKPILKYFYQTKANMFNSTDAEVMIKIDPVIEFGLGYEPNFTEARKFVNTRGLEMRGWISKKVGFYFYAADNQFRPASYVQSFIRDNGAIPHAGYYKLFKPGQQETGFDYFIGRGYLDFKVYKYFTVTFGTDRNFIGNGFRSLFLSDFSNDYLFLKVSTKVGNFEYTNLFCEGIENYDVNSGDDILPKRYAAYHHLSYNARPWLNLGFFEGVIFARTYGYELKYLNPIIFYRAVEQGLGSPDNSTIGVDGKINALKCLQFYGQIFLDDIQIKQFVNRTGWWGNKFAVQAGMKYIDAFTVKNLDLQAEINFVKPYAYTHDDTLSSYTNYNLPLAHVLGANFKEAIGIIKYQPLHNLYITAKGIYYIKGFDLADSINAGGAIKKISTEQTIIQSYGNFIGQGYELKTLLGSLNIAYEIRHNLFVDIEAVYRRVTDVQTATTTSIKYGFLKFRWNIPAKHYDF